MKKYMKVVFSMKLGEVLIRTFPVQGCFTLMNFYIQNEKLDTRYYFMMHLCWKTFHSKMVWVFVLEN